MASDATRPGGSHRAGSFHELGDEFAGDAANEEWDAAWEAYTSGSDTSGDASAAPLRATLQLPAGPVELRGDVDGHTLGVLADLLDPGSVTVDEVFVDDPPSPLALTVHGDTDWKIDQDGVGTVAEWAIDAHVADSLSVELLRCIQIATIRSDVHHLHVPAACVELEGIGIVLAGGTRSARNLLVVELLRGGASYLSTDDLVLQPGTRAVRGTAAPLLVSTSAATLAPIALVPASTRSTVIAHCAVGVIVLLGDADEPVGSVDASGRVDESIPPEVSPVDVAELVQRMVEMVDSTSPLADTALDLISNLAVGATCVELDVGAHPTEAAAVAAAASITSVAAPERRRLVLSFRSEVDVATQDPAAGPSSGRMTRFDRGAVLVEAPGGSPRVLIAAQADEIERRFAPRRGAGPGPEAFGLPGCPSGAFARRLWADSAALRVSDAGRAGSTRHSGEAAMWGTDLPTGVAAELVGRDLLPADDGQREQVVDRHAFARELAEQTVEVLLDVLHIAQGVGVEPVVVGSIVQAYDGPLPAHFTDVDGIDLLVRDEHLDRLLEQLEDHGFEPDARTLSGAGLSTASDRRLCHPKHPRVAIDLHRTLAVGPFGELVDPEEFHRRAVPFTVGGRWALALHPEHRFVYACLRADGGREAATVAELRDVVLAAPRAEQLMAEAMECSARWGATTSVLAVVRAVDSRLSGLSPWLVDRATKYSGGQRRRRRGLRRR